MVPIDVSRDTQSMVVGRISQLDKEKRFEKLDRVMSNAQTRKEILTAIDKIEKALLTNDLKTIREECIYVRGIFS